MSRVLFQGDVDDLCGYYATLNALRRVIGQSLTSARSAELLRYLISRTPKKLLSGTLNKHTKRLVQLAAAYIQKEGFFSGHIQVQSKNIRSKTPLSYQDELKLLLSKNIRSAAMVSVKKEDEHWIVVATDALGELDAIDSSDGLYDFNEDCITFGTPTAKCWFVKPRVLLIEATVS